MPKTPDAINLAQALIPLIQRFTGNQPDALAQLRTQIESEREAGRQMMERADAQLAALDYIESQAGENGADEIGLLMPPPPLKTGILRILKEDPEQAWHREALFKEIARRGWAPGGTNPRNTFTSRLRDLELDGRVRRLDRDIFQAKKDSEVLA